MSRNHTSAVMRCVAICALVSLVTSSLFATEAIVFRRGDANGDGSYNISDSVAILLRVFTDNDIVPCEKAADVDDNGELEMVDALFVLNAMFLRGPEPKAPFPGCGIDPSEDSITCDRYGPCEG